MSLVTMEPLKMGDSPVLEENGQATVCVVVILQDRPEPLDELYREYAAGLRDAGYVANFIFISGSDMRRCMEPLLPLMRDGAPITVLEAAQNVGETALLRSALGYCRDPVVVTLPAYRLVEAASIPKLVQRLDSGADLVVASRSSTNDPLVNRLQRRVVHTLVRYAVGGNFHDLGSGVRAVRTEVLREIPLYGESARFLPLLAQREGFITAELPVPQHARDQRPRVYSPGIYLRRLLDLAGVFFLVRFREKPLRFFGLIGSGLTAVGGIILAVLAVQKLGGRALADRPMLLLAVLFVVVGLQAIALGLVGEIIVHTTARRHQTYRVSRRVEAP
jgi:hypothetical protein